MESSSREKHLEMIQSVVSRLAGNSFLLKGWGATLVTAVLVIDAKFGVARAAPFALGLLLIFWMLDSYYLVQERRFRRLYDLVRESSTDLKFSMDVSLAKNRPHIAGAWSSITIFWFWAALLLVVIFGWLYLL